MMNRCGEFVWKAVRLHPGICLGGPILSRATALFPHCMRAPCCLPRQASSHSAWFRAGVLCFRRTLHLCLQDAEGTWHRSCFVHLEMASLASWGVGVLYVRLFAMKGPEKRHVVSSTLFPQGRYIGGCTGRTG